MPGLFIGNNGLVISSGLSFTWLSITSLHQLLGGTSSPLNFKVTKTQTNSSSVGHFWFASYYAKESLGGNRLYMLAILFYISKDLACCENKDKQLHIDPLKVTKCICHDWLEALGYECVIRTIKAFKQQKNKRMENYKMCEVAHTTRNRPWLEGMLSSSLNENKHVWI